MDTIPKQNATLTLASVANAMELSRHVIAEVVGNDIADTLEGSPLSRETLYNLAQSDFLEHFAPYRKD